VSRPLESRTVLVTGGTGGIGLQTAIALAELGLQVVITGRDAAHGAAALDAIDEACRGDAAFVAGDLSTRSGVEALAATIVDRYGSLDAVIHNAGAAAPDLRRTADGLELDFAVNAAAPFGLTRLLRPALLAAGAARVVTLSGGSAGSPIDLANLNVERGFRGLQTYSHSKRATEAMSLALARRLEPDAIMVNIVYPGQASTAMTRGVTPGMLDWWMRPLWPIFKRLVADDGGRSAAAASRSSVWAATAPELDGVTGAYYDSACQRGRLHASVLDPAAQEAVVARIERVWGPSDWGDASVAAA
jgi:NAD(P)-dependent dehydrogenase (short-subunit alcohol dehydrogenase family)